MTEQALVCVHCQKGLDAGFFEIKHVNRAGRAAPNEIRVCSLVCLVNWSVSYGARRGLQGVSMIKQLLSSLKG